MEVRRFLGVILRVFSGGRGGRPSSDPIEAKGGRPDVKGGREDSEDVRPDVRPDREGVRLLLGAAN